jgi:hypothetical protein
LSLRISYRSIVSKQAEDSTSTSTLKLPSAEMTLPSPDTIRWVVSRKAIVLAAIDTGRLSIHEACMMYRLSVEEIASWSRMVELHGSNGLKNSSLGKHRKSQPPTLG